MNTSYPDAHRGVGTSVAAYERFDRSQLRRKVVAAINASGSAGLTTDELAVALKLPRYSVQPRTTELKHDGVIRDSKMRRRNASGSNATAWIAVGATGGAV